jgi:hypothetical protein
MRRERRKERIPRLSATLRYTVLSEDSFVSLIFFRQLLLVVALERKPAWRRIPLFNLLTFSYTPTNHSNQCMSHVISMHRPDDPRQTAVSDLSKVILCLVPRRFEHSTLVVHAKQYHYSAIAAHDKRSIVRHSNLSNQMLRKRYFKILTIERN